MRSYRTLRNVALLLSASILGALSLSGMARAVTDRIFQYTTPKTGYLALHPSAFAPSDYGSASRYINDSNTDALSLNAMNACFNAGVNLPQGAQVRAVAGWFSTNSANASMHFYNASIATGDNGNYVLKNIPNTGGARKGVSVATSAVIDNQRYFWGLTVCFDAGDVFHGARITFTYNNAGD